MNKTALLFTNPMTVDVTKFIDKFKEKYEKNWGNIVTPELEDQWKLNCQILNHAINKPQPVMKYVVSAPTGSAKTENLITYCSMLPEDVRVIISTNLTEDADLIAGSINIESTKPKACSFHSQNDINLLTAATWPIVVTTHAFYKKHYTGSPEWNFMVENRDLLVIDEALDTMQEISVEDTDIARALLLFKHLYKFDQFKSNTRFATELKFLEEDLEILSLANADASLVRSDKLWKLTNGTMIPSINIRKYILFLAILGEKEDMDEGYNTNLNKYGKSIPYNYVFTGKFDPSHNLEFRETLYETLDKLNNLHQRQAYVTASYGNKSFNRVTDMMFTKTVVCFDATSEINKVYQLREEHYSDLDRVERVQNIRNYSKVGLHKVVGKTGQNDFDKKIATSIIKGAKLGSKTLIVTHKKNKAVFEQAATDLYPRKTIEFAHWNAITGKNDWKDFDTCIIAGLNHKPRSYSQNRVIVNTDTEAKAFGSQQNDLNNMVANSVLSAEIIQAMNRIRIRKVVDEKGNCDPADIYIVLPYHKDGVIINEIKKEMTNIQIKEWKLDSSIVIKESKVKFDIVMSYVLSNLQDGEKMHVNEPRDELNINKDSYKSMLGSTDSTKEAFKRKIHDYGLEIVESTQGSRGRQRTTYPKKYFSKIGFSPLGIY